MMIKMICDPLDLDLAILYFQCYQADKAFRLCCAYFSLHQNKLRINVKENLIPSHMSMSTSSLVSC